MPEEVLFKSESTQSRDEIASYLRSVAEKLEQGGAITLKARSESVPMDPPARWTFEVKAEREGPADGAGELSIAILAQSNPGTETTDVEAAGTPQREAGTSETPVAEGEQHAVEIEDAGEQGDGIARVGPGYIVFVPETAIGDRVTVEITQVKESVAFAEVVEDEPIAG